MTTTYEALRTTLDALKKATVSAPKAELRYHGASTYLADTIMRALPDLTWKAEGGQAGGGVWIRGRHHDREVEVVIHLAPVQLPAPDDPTLTAARELVAEATS